MKQNKSLFFPSYCYNLLQLVVSYGDMSHIILKICLFFALQEKEIIQENY